MTFKTIKGCRRSREEQRYIWSALEIWNRLPERRREEMRELIGGVSGSPLESRALYDVLVRGCAPQAVSSRTGVPVTRLYAMRRDFFERFRI